MEGGREEGKYESGEEGEEEDRGVFIHLPAL